MKIQLSEEFYRRMAEIEEPEGGVFACSPEIYAEMTRSIPMMRAKFMVTGVTEGAGYGPNHQPGDEMVKVSERLTFCAVGHNKAYEVDGTGDEDNTFSRWTPCANLDITIQNPALFGQFKYGDKFYVDFTPADTQPAG